MAYKHRLPSTEELVDLAKQVDAMARAQGVAAALAGGLAMQLAGSPRLTKDVDFVSDTMVDLRPEFRRGRPIAFGGQVFVGKMAEIDWIVRNDEYAALYLDALQAAEKSREGFLVVTREHLSAMKLAAGRATDYEDLMYLLGRPKLVNTKKALNLVHRFLGGRFAVDQFKGAVEEAHFRKRHGG